MKPVPLDMTDTSTSPLLPPETPLAHPVQDLRKRHNDNAAPKTLNDGNALVWRIAAFLPAIAATFGLYWVMAGWFEEGGVNIIEASLIALICFNFFWISLTVSTVVCGIVSLTRQGPQESACQRTERLNVALLVPVYNENPWYVMGNARAILSELRQYGGHHTYSMFILSDTRDDVIADREIRAVQALRAELPPGSRLYYRRRPMNTDRKVGNISDWVSRWGAGYSAMLVLDADSLMTGSAIGQLADAMARDPGAGLIQSFPQLIGAQTLFARSQQFANGVYGIALAEGLSRWSGREGNYWGHNAIIRTAAFAGCAGLPKVKSLGGKDRLIMSHDFVEAGLLRRAGWGVRFLSRIRGSYEETPANLTDHIQRDRRWCQGNLQHLRLLTTRGFHPLSRFHLFHGAMGYMLSPVWFLLLIIWALIGNGQEASVLTYFSEENPLFPIWPEMSEGWHLLVLLLMYAMLLAPKFLGAASLSAVGIRLRDLGGYGRFAFSFLSEVVLSIAYAPILMVQQMIAVFRTVLGVQKGWHPQRREGGHYGWRTLFVSHALETVSGIGLLIGILSGMVTLWLLPIAVSLAFAVPLSFLSGMVIANSRMNPLGTVEVYNEPPIMQAARHYRRQLKDHLEGASAAGAPAE